MTLKLMRELEKKSKKLEEVERKLKESEEKFHLAFHTNPDSIDLSRLSDGRFIDVNDGFCNLMGYKRDEVIGKTSIELNLWINTKDRDRMVSILDESGKVDNFEAVFRKKDEEIRIGLLSARKVTHNNQYAILSITRDITEKRKIEDKIKENEERFRSIIKNADIGYFFININGIFEDVNNAWIKLYKYSSVNEIIGKHFTSVFNYDGVDVEFKRFLRGKKKNTSGEANRICKDGTKGYHTYTVRKVTHRDKVIGLEGFIFDTTSRYIAEEALRSSEAKMQSIFRVAPSGIGVVKDRYLIEVNPRISKLTGYTKEELIGKSARILYPSQKEFDYVGKEKYRKIQESGIGEVETKWQRKDGTIIDILMVSTPIDIDNLSKGIIFTVLDNTERKRIEIALRDSEERFRSIITNADIGYFFVDSQGIIRNVNTALVNLYKYDSAEELIGEHYTKFQSLEKAEYVNEILHGILEGRTEYQTGEFSRICKDGSIGYHIFSAKPVYHNHEIIGIEGFLSDTTRRRETENELRKLSIAVEQSPVSVVITDPNGKIEYVNPKFCELTGYSEEEVIGENSRILKSGEITNDVYKQLWDIILRGGIWHGEFHNKKKNGDLYWEDAVISAITDADGKIINFIAVKEDITRRKLAEQALQESEYKLLEAQKIAKVGYYVFNIKTGYWTNSVELNDIYGIDENYKKNLDGWIDIIHPEFKELVLEYFKQDVLKNHNKFDKQYKIINKKTGKEQWVHSLGSLKFDEHNELIEIFGTCQDITESMKIQNHLAHTQKMESIGQLAAGIAHDCNNIITAINGFATLAMDQMDKKSTGWNFLNEILDAGNRAAKLTSQLLTFSRNQVIEPKLININSAILRMDKMLNTILGVGVDLKINLDKQLYSVVADVIQVEQILLNLIINGRDAILEKERTQGKKEITIETKNIYLNEDFVKSHNGSFVGNSVLVSVSDTGCGIQTENLVKIFDPFYTTKEEGKGTGLGLSTVYGIVKQNNGYINVYSEPGEGTRFNIYWPSTKEEKNIDEVEYSEKFIGGRETILVVDDDKSVIKFVNAFLSSLGYKVYTSTDPIEAIRLSKKAKSEIQLLITDIYMPKLNGKELADHILKFTPNLKVIYASGYSETHIRQSGILDEESIVINKPYSLHLIAKKIREILD